MGIRGIVGRAIAELGVRLAGDDLFPREPGFPAGPIEARELTPEDAFVLAPHAFHLTPEGEEMVARFEPPAPRLETPPPPPLAGSAEDRIARARAGVRS